MSLIPDQQTSFSPDLVVSLSDVFHRVRDSQVVRESLCRKRLSCVAALEADLTQQTILPRPLKLVPQRTARDRHMVSTNLDLAQVHDLVGTLLMHDAERLVPCALGQIAGLAAKFLDPVIIVLESA